MSFAILGLGTAVPSATAKQADSLAIARSLFQGTDEQESWLPTMYQGTGIRTRHLAFSQTFIDDMVHGTRHSGSIFLPTGQPGDSGPSTAQRMAVYRTEAPPLALRACQAAFAESGMPARELTHLITVSCTGFEAPGIDHFLIRELGLPQTTQRTHIGFMGCHGALNGLRVARAFADADPEARVLLCAVEFCALHCFYGWDPGRMIANAIFADGAAAVVGKRADGLASDHGRGTGGSPVPSRRAACATEHWQVVGSGSCVFPGSSTAMSWTIGDHGFLMTLAKNVPSLIAAHLRPWLEKWLFAHGLTIGDVGSWAIHPGGPRILDAAQEALGLTASQTEDAQAVFADYGNMSSPTVLFIVDRLRRRRAPRPCVALGFGPGLAVEAALIQ